MIHRVDPELVPPLDAFVSYYGGQRTLHDIPAVRAMAARLTALTKLQMPRSDAIDIEDRAVPGPPGAPDVVVRIYRARAHDGIRPALLWIHGGGYVLGSIEADDLRIQQLAEAVECTVVSVEYRLAPEHPFPAALEDCYAALKWLSSHASDLRIDRRRVAIGGASAGAGLAAGLALLVRDRAELAVAFQLLIYPMIDDRNVDRASDACLDTLLWTRDNNRAAWRAYLGDVADTSGVVSPYAAAFRATDVGGVPPAYLSVGELDLFINENITYAQRLIEAGVPTELHVYPGAYHSFDTLAPRSAVGRRFIADRDSALRRALAL
jgi:acetyl esterase/lipase